MPGQGSTDKPPVSQSHRRQSTARGSGPHLHSPDGDGGTRALREGWHGLGGAAGGSDVVHRHVHLWGQTGVSMGAASGSRSLHPCTPQTPKSAPAQPWWCCQRCNIGCCTVGSWRGCWSPGCPAPAKPRFELPTHQEPWPGSRARSQPGCLPVMEFGLCYESVAAPSGASSASGQGAPWGAPVTRPCALPRDGRTPGVHLCRIQLEAAPAAARHKLGAQECAGLSAWLRIQGIISQSLGSTPAAPAAPMAPAPAAPTAPAPPPAAPTAPAPPPPAPTAPAAPALACSASTDLQFPATLMQ